jgi:tetratricopeptide (TPR) repeat protein
MLATYKHLPLVRVAAAALVLASIVAVSWAVSWRGAGAAVALDEGVRVEGARAGSTAERQVAALQERLRADARDWQAASQLGAAYLQRARETGDPSYYGRAEEALRRALDEQPDDYAAVSSMGALALARHQFAEALTWGERARAINPGRSYSYGVVADALTELGRYDEAVAAAQQMVDLRPDLASYSRVSYARELHGDIAGATEAMEAAVSAGLPGSENAEWVRVQLGNLLFAQGRLAAAEQRYAQSLAALPGYVPAMAGMARLRAAQGRSDEAVAMLEDASARMPLPEYVIALGELHESLGNAAEAERQYALVRAMQRLFAANGVDTDLELALFEADHGDAAAAAQLARAAYARRPGVKGTDTLAWALYRAGQPDEARRYSDEALRLGSRDPLLLYHAGMIALGEGDKGRARELLGRALEPNPHFAPLHADRARAALESLSKLRVTS